MEVTNENAVNHLLQKLIGVISSHDQLTCTIAFLSNGLIIQGDIVSEKKYVQNWASKVGSPNSDAYGLSRKVKTSFEKQSEIETALNVFLNDVRQVFKSLNEPDASSSELPAFYICLQNAEAKMPGGESEEIEVWRGRIDTIDSIISISPIRPVESQ
jgi:hypothetical protein